ncbi:hypothetical protein [Nocardia jiangxiensis]|uniref:Uncharacterized protein n=1 Tax=Nocardia jiangxiensis TaxID=282685 RepID=A0ABW6SEK1_9NOCA|nr:hypothetical protein [Nocardia jiangxiensis]
MPVAPNATAAHLVRDIVARYGSLDAFCARLRGSVENPTEELRRLTGTWAGPGASPAPVRAEGEGDGGGRHRSQR